MAHVLVIDDDVSIQKMLVTVLEDDGHQVSVADDGQQGLALAFEDLPDLVVTDMSLPLKTGWDVIAALKNNESTRNTPVIALSAYDSQGDRDAGHEAGCNAYVGKPIDFGVLMKNVRALLPAA